MKIIEPKVELLSELNISPESHIARCARVCYGKEYKEPNQEADEKMVNGLIKRNHLSMLRHSSAYFVFANHLPEELKSEYVNTLSQEDYIYASTNGQFTLEHNNKADLNSHVFLNLCRKYPELFELYRLTFCITTQISTSRELNRKSPNAIAERSTRYCSSKDGLLICRPWWLSSAKEATFNSHSPINELWYYNNAISKAGISSDVLLNHQGLHISKPSFEEQYLELLSAIAFGDFLLSSRLVEICVVIQKVIL